MGPRRHGGRPAGRTRRRRRACPRRRPLPRRRLVSPPRRGGTHGPSTPPAVSVRLGDADDDLAAVLTGEHGVEGGPEELRGGEEGVRTCRSGWQQVHSKKKTYRMTVKRKHEQ